MVRELVWLFLLVASASTLVDTQFTEDYESTDDDLNPVDDGEVGDDDGDYNDVFDDYFDDEMRVVDVDQDVAIKGCVSNSDALVKKIDAAYDKCFKDFEDWTEFQENNDGNDEDKDGLSDEYEADEACFYKKMKWVVNSKPDKEAIKNDFKNLNSKTIQKEFVSSIEACSVWNGKFKGRKKRDAEVDSWALSLARERRAANGKQGKGAKKGDNKGKGAKKGDKKGKGNGKGSTKTRRGRGKGKGGKGRRRGKGKGIGKRNGDKGKGKGKGGRNGKIGRNGKGGNKDGKKGRNGKGGKGKGTKAPKNKNDLTRAEKKTINELLPEDVYNQLWCYELSVEKALENCVQEKLLN